MAAAWAAAGKRFRMKVDSGKMGGHVPSRRITQAVALAIALGTARRAGAQSWVPLGPDGGTVLAVAVAPAAPATVYAGTLGGVFRSTDGGGTWAASATGMPAIRVSALAIDPGAAGTVYAATETGLFTSADAGATWTQRDPSRGLSLAIDPQTPGTAYAGTTGGVLKSIDGGAHWQDAGGLAKTVQALVAVPGRLYAATAHQGVFRSPDAGATWAPMATGLTDLTTFALAADPNAPATLYAGTGSGLFVTLNGGDTWSPVPLTGGGAVFRIASIAVSPNGAVYVGTAHSGVFSSPDGGNEAPFAASSGPADSDIAVLAALLPPGDGADTVWAGTVGGGLFKSPNGAGTWMSRSTGLRALEVFALAEDGETPPVVFAATNGGLFTTADQGQTWAPSPTPVAATAVNVLASDPTSPTTIYAGTDRDGLLKTVDGGHTWSRMHDGPGDPSIAALVVDPTPAGALYAATENGVRKTGDGGVTWDAIDTGLPAGAITALARDPAGPLYAGATGAVFVSTDGGTTWTPTGAGLPLFAVLRLVAAGVPKAAVYAGTDKGVFRLRSDGTWTGANRGLTRRNVRDLLIDPRDAASIYAGTTAGVFTSPDGANRWGTRYGGLDAEPITALALARDPSASVYVGTAGNGVFRLDVPRCHTAPDCDDQNECTTESCSPLAPTADLGGCTTLRIPGCTQTSTTTPTTTTTSTVPCQDGTFDGILCRLQNALALPTCAHDTMPRSVRRLARQAGTLIGRAGSAHGRRARSLARRAAKVLRKAGRRAGRAEQQGLLSSDCGAALLSALGDARTRAEQLSHRLPG